MKLFPCHQVFRTFGLAVVFSALTICLSWAGGGQHYPNGADGIMYWPKQGPFSLTLKQYWEYGARNIATGPQAQFKISYAF